ncbi:MAG: hypothetical protein IJH78_08935 [Clostridia bacterium]|nr:hypothetical protein [Clostridia bacterium]
MNMFEGICGKVAPGLCRLSMDGSIAIKTTSGYRSFDPTRKRLMNCDHFVMDVGEDFFFVLPASRVRPGDIILAGGKPKCVTGVEGETITAINFEDATVETLLPEHHLFMGNTYLFGKIVSLFGKNGVRGQKGTGRIMKYMMLSSLLKGKEGAGSGLLPMLLLGGKTDFMDDLFDFGEDGPTDEEEA